MDLLSFSLGALATLPLWLALMAAAWLADRRTRTTDTDTAGRIELVDDREELLP